LNYEGITKQIEKKVNKYKQKAEMEYLNEALGIIQIEKGIKTIPDYAILVG